MNIFILAKYQITGGAEKMVCSFANQLSLLNEVHLALRVRPDFDEATLNLEKKVKLLKIYEPPFPDISKFKNWLKVDWKHFWMLRNYLIKHKIDIIYAHDISIAQGALLKLLTGKPLVWHNHNGEMLEFTTAKRQRFNRYLFNTNAIISVSETLTQYCSTYFRKSKRKYFTIPNFISIDKQEGSTQLPSGFNIVYVANIRKVKNQLLLLTAFESFKQHHPDANLFFVGKGVDSAYEQLLNEHIAKSTFKKNIYSLGEKNDISNILKQSQIGVLSSQSEGLPLVLLEYGLANIPVIASDIPICKSLLKDGLYGYLFESNNAESLATGLMNIKKDYDGYSKKATDFNMSVQRDFNREKIMAEIQHVFSLYAPIN